MMLVSVAPSPSPECSSGGTGVPPPTKGREPAVPMGFDDAPTELCATIGCAVGRNKCFNKWFLCWVNVNYVVFSLLTVLVMIPWSPPWTDPTNATTCPFDVVACNRQCALMHVNCTENNRLWKGGGSNAGAVDTRLIPASAGTIFSFTTITGGDQGVTVACSADVVVAAGHTSETDYMVVPPESTEWYGVASTVISLSQSGMAPLEVTESCNDGSSRTYTIPGGGTGAVSQTGYTSHYNGKACRYSAGTIQRAWLRRRRRWGCCEHAQHVAGIGFLRHLYGLPVSCVRLSGAWNLHLHGRHRYRGGGSGRCLRQRRVQGQV